jgi:hypothetical protein
MKIWAKTEELKEGKFLVVRRDGTVPHWPHFVLGARDPATPEALRAYARECVRLGLDKDFTDSVFELAHDFERYRFEQGQGDADAPPHRKDSSAVLTAMRGGDATICVRVDKCNVKKPAA